MKRHVIISEETLVEGLRARHEKSFEILYDNYANTLLGIISKIVRDEDEAENLLQDTFVKVWRNIQQYDPQKGRLFTWLLNIARNTAINYLRTQAAVYHEPIEVVNNEAGMSAVSTDPVVVEYIGVSELVQKLDPKLKQVIDLLYFGGYTQQEVAEHLALPLGTVKTRTRMALAQLKHHFRRDYHP